MKFTGADQIELKKVTEGDCGFIASLFDNDEYELYFSENETTEIVITSLSAGLHNIGSRVVDLDVF